MSRWSWAVPALLVLGLVTACSSDSPTSTEPPPVEPDPTVWTPPNALPAFPGAEGFGAYTVHGRGGRLTKVTNLNDSGPGSLRDALQGNDLPPRFVVFDVGGVIELETPIIVRSGSVYVAGQSAPGDGITLKGAQLSIQASDVAIRFLRTRPGDGPRGAPFESRDGIHIMGSASRHLRNIILDHISSSWSVDENVTVQPGSGGSVENVTIQWSITSEALHDSFHPKGPHSMGMLIAEGSRFITIHHNLMAHNNQRNPRIKHDARNVDVVNNVLYNWGQFAAEIGERADLPPTTVNFVKNFWKAGPDSPQPALRREVRVKPMSFDHPSGPSGIYFEGNHGPSRPPGAAEWALSDVEQAFPGQLQRYVRPSRFVHAPVQEHSAQAAYDLVLDRAGATVPVRDAVDLRVVASVRTGTGRIIDSPADVGGYPAYAAAARPADWDTDGDGIPDAWELANGLNPNDPSDGNRDRNGDGYTNVEEYLNSLVR
jgi:pectate lyase